MTSTPACASCECLAAKQPFAKGSSWPNAASMRVGFGATQVADRDGAGRSQKVRARISLQVVSLRNGEVEQTHMAVEL